MPPSPAQSELAKIKISPRGVTRLKSGHVWVYRSDIVAADGIPPGSVVTVTDQRVKSFGTDMYSSSSQIAVRMISHEAVYDLPALLRRRIAESVAYREKLVHDTDAYRLIFSEADFLPGLIVDRYNDILSMQIVTQAVDANPVRSPSRLAAMARLAMPPGQDPMPSAWISAPGMGWDGRPVSTMSKNVVPCMKTSRP